MESKKILITGAGGYIGSVATYIFLEKGYEVVALDNFSKGYKEPLEFLQDKFGKEKIRYYNVDLNDIQSIKKLLNEEKNIQAVVHYAALHEVNESMLKPELYFSNNVFGSKNLLDALLENNINKIIFSSTCAVYGNAEYMPVDEKHSINPSSPYAESKRLVERIMYWYRERLGLNYVILRYFNVCGASDDGLIGDSQKPSNLLMQNAVRGALGIEEFKLTCPKVDTPDQTPIRDYVNVVDLNEAHLLAMEYLLGGGESEIINLGTGQGNSVLEIVNTVKRITGADFSVSEGEKRQGESSKVYANIEKAKDVLHWEPKRSIEDSVKSLVKWYTNHPLGWKE